MKTKIIKWRINLPLSIIPKSKSTFKAMTFDRLHLKFPFKKIVHHSQCKKMSKTKRKFSLPSFKSRTTKQDVQEFLIPSSTNTSPAIPTSPSLGNLQQRKNTNNNSNANASSSNNNESLVSFGRTTSAGNRLMGHSSASPASSSSSSDEGIKSANYLVVPNSGIMDEGSSSSSGSTSPRNIPFNNKKSKTPPTMSPPSSPRSNLLQWLSGRKANEVPKDSDLKIALFGCEGSGKSTLFKQCEKIIGGKYAEKAVNLSATFIQQNLVEVLRALFEGILKEQESNGDVALDWATCQKMKNFISKHASEKLIGDKVIDAATWYDILHDSRVKEILDNIHDYKNLNYSIGNCIEYYISEYERLTSSEYRATERDYIVFQQRTTGVISRIYTYKDKSITLMDLAGVRTERKKWSAVMKCCQALVYVASLSEFDLVCWEDITTNRFIEDLTTFKDWITNESIKNQPVFLVLTNVDRFKKKLDSPNKVTILNSLLSIGNDNNNLDADFYLTSITNKFKEVDLGNRVCEIIITNSLDTEDLVPKLSQIFDKILEKCK